VAAGRQAVDLPALLGSRCTSTGDDDVVFSVVNLPALLGSRCTCTGGRRRAVAARASGE